ncbi:pyridoxamine 5'-phosphate oxidase [Gordonia sp. TBRC 11910]|uniref:Pyridoxine/pyridoxamine 5'-phosphate oxidase n=1 Tax=Gordonia asplenii TaxID=2725283 RepID=A0A848KXJ4_9ACTN|nr:pyridoxamine 5'-phosphate oxidase [Gordonia asplenii]NMO01575.1 pyridoxamine 5'-phosphate oxidase [Gordonia asplenii]
MRVGYGARADIDSAGADGVAAHLDTTWLTGDPPWLSLFNRWLADVVRTSGPTGISPYIEANAMVLGTVDADGHPQTRTVLCKGVDAAGVVFFTGYDSAKGLALQANPYASVTFPWINLERQVHFRGPVTKVSAQETREYWDSRPRGSQLSAFASAQSYPIGSRAELEELAASTAERFADDQPVPVPPTWGGYRIEPRVVEFWQGRADRLHNRVRARMVDGEWLTERLQP